MAVIGPTPGMVCRNPGAAAFLGQDFGDLGVEQGDLVAEATDLAQDPATGDPRWPGQSAADA